MDKLTKSENNLYKQIMCIIQRERERDSRFSPFFDLQLEFLVKSRTFHPCIYGRPAEKSYGARKNLRKATENLRKLKENLKKSTGNQGHPHNGKGKPQENLKKWKTQRKISHRQSEN